MTTAAVAETVVDPLMMIGTVKWNVTAEDVITTMTMEAGDLALDRQDVTDMTKAAYC